MGGVLSWKEGVFAKLNIQLPCQDGKLKRSMGLRGPDSQRQERWRSERCHQVRAMGVGISLELLRFSTYVFCVVFSTLGS